MTNSARRFVRVGADLADVDLADVVAMNVGVMSLDGNLVWIFMGKVPPCRKGG
jgi:hypothetical protein